MLLERGPRCHTVMKTLFREVICLEAPILERGCNRLISSVCLSLPRLSVALPLSSSCSLCSSWHRKTKCCINKHLLRIELLTSMPQTCQLLCYIEHKLTVRVQWICGGNISAQCHITHLATPVTSIHCQFRTTKHLALQRSRGLCGF